MPIEPPPQSLPKPQVQRGPSPIDLVESALEHLGHIGRIAFGLQKFGGMEYTGRIIGLSFSRELAPTLTAVIVGGRIGSGIAAEVGSMNVTEQIDAIRALGADP